MFQPPAEKTSDIQETISTLLLEGQALFDQAAERSKDIERNEEIYRQLGLTDDVGARAKAKKAFDGLQKLEVFAPARVRGLKHGNLCSICVTCPHTGRDSLTEKRLRLKHRSPDL